MAVITDRLTELAAAAKSASEAAYSPYSNFAVGAAILTQSGEVFTGCNVENASFGLTICAERNAAFQAVAQGQREISAVAIYTPTPTPTAPCGACRQVLFEFGPDAQVYCICDGEDVIHSTVSDLLPGAFGPDDV